MEAEREEPARDDSRRVAPSVGSPEPPTLEIVRGRVSGLLKGGFEVQLEGALGFCSLSQIDVRRVVEASSFLQRELDFAVVSRDPGGSPWRLSRRKVLERDARARLAELRSRIVAGAVLRARVSRLTDFGAFVDLGGIEGLVHVSEISHGRIERPSDAIEPGDDVDVRVLRVGSGKSGRVSLSIKAAQADPWSSAGERFRPWHVVDGRLLRTTEFGAFLELGPGIEGLLHVSELPPGALAKLEEPARVGALMAVLVLEVDSRRRRVALAPAPRGVEPGARVEPRSLRAGTLVSGRIEGVQSATVLVRLGPGQLGVIAGPELGIPRWVDPHEEFPLGTEIEAEVMRIEGRGRRVQLSRKRAARRREREEIERYASEHASGSLSSLGELLEQARDRKSL